MSRRNWLIGAIVAAGLLFAVQGGEYSSTDLLTLKRQVREEQASITALKSEIDSLQALARAVEKDPVMQERIAREEFGMIRNGEFLYRLVQPADSTGR